jgi:hypothetical protein
MVQPATLIAWHRRAFALYWTWKSRRPPGRLNTTAEIRDLIRRMSQANPLWDSPECTGTAQVGNRGGAIDGGQVCGIFPADSASPLASGPKRTLPTQGRGFFRLTNISRTYSSTWQVGNTDAFEPRVICGNGRDDKHGRDPRSAPQTEPVETRTTFSAVTGRRYTLGISSRREPPGIGLLRNPERGMNLAAHPLFLRSMPFDGLSESTSRQ